MANIPQMVRQPFLHPMGLEQTLFPDTSRYHGAPIRTLERADGKRVAYLDRRILPQLERFAILSEHTVLAGERLDQIASEYLGDPEQFWRIADSNSALNPFQLTEEAGTKLRITLPEGVPGPSYV